MAICAGCALDQLCRVSRHNALVCRLVWDLREAAAARGSSRAQALQGVATTFGLTRPSQPHQLFDLIPAAPAQPSTGSSSGDAAATVHYHFGAQGQSALAHAALGQRHRRGVHAPKACEVALLHLAEAGAAAADQAASAQGLPVVRDPL